MSSLRVDNTTSGSRIQPPSSKMILLSGRAVNNRRPYSSEGIILAVSTLESRQIFIERYHSSCQHPKAHRRNMYVVTYSKLHNYLASLAFAITSGVRRQIFIGILFYPSIPKSWQILVREICMYAVAYPCQAVERKTT